MEWFKLYHGAISDVKWPAIARKSKAKVGEVVSVWIALLDYASQQEERGSVEGFDCETIDALYGYKDGKCKAILAAMIEKGLVQDEIITEWEKRQSSGEKPEKSSGYDRVKRYRDRHRANDNANDNGDNAGDNGDNGLREDKIRKDFNINSASGDAAQTSKSSPECKKKKGRPPDGPYYQSKNGKYLTGEALSGFERFWDAFDFRHGKA